MTRLPDDVVLRGIVTELIPAKARAAIRVCASRGLGDARNIRGIVAVARELDACPKTVAAAFGFLPDARSPRSFVDVWADDECKMALLPRKTAIASAFALSRLYHPDGAPFVVE